MKWKTVIITGMLTLVISLIVSFGFSDSFQLSTKEDTAANVSETHTVTLITGDKVFVEQFPDGYQEIEIEPVERNGYEPSFETMEIDEEHVYVIPDDIIHFTDGKLDRDLFNITKLIEQGYTDEQMGHIPLIITLANTTSAQSVADVEASFNSKVSDVTSFSSINGLSAKVPKDDTTSFNDALFTQASSSTNDSTVTSLQSTELFSNIEEIRLDRKFEVELEDSVPQIGVPETWEAGYDGTGLTVAVLDSGIDDNHPDLSGKVVAAQNFSTDDTTDDLGGHGTHVASIIAGSGDASDGLRQGVAPGASLINVKVLNAEGSGFESDIIEGMEWAAQEGATILNMSLGGAATDGSDPMSQAVDSISKEYNVLFVVSAGNSGPGSETVTTPGTADSALTVGAVDKSGELAMFSSRGPRVGDYTITPHITAPGVGIQAALADGTSIGNPVDDHYTALDGTSMAAPHVAGVAALLAHKWEENEQDIEAETLKAALVSTANPHEDFTVYQQGSGLVDAERALMQDVFAVTPTLDMGYFEYPHDDRYPVTKTVTYQNTSDKEVTLELAVDVEAPDGQFLPESMIKLSEEEVTVAAGETADVEVTVDSTLGQSGLYGGYITAQSTVEGSLIHTPLGFYKEFETYDLTIKGITRDNQVVREPSRVSVMNNENTSIFRETDIRFPHEEVGEITISDVPAGSYSVLGLVYSAYDESAEKPDPTEVAFVHELEVEVSEDTTVTLDARKSNQIIMDVKDDVNVLDSGITYHRAAEEGGAITQTFGFSQDFYAAPTDQVTNGDYEMYTDWEMDSPADAPNPYTYRLVIPEDPIPADLHYVIEKDDLAKINNKYYAHQEDQQYRISQHKWRPFERASFAMVRNIDAPQERMEYFMPNDTVFRKNVRPLSDELRMTEYRTTYEQGEFEQTWFKQPMRSGLFAGNVHWKIQDLYTEKMIF